MILDGTMVVLVKKDALLLYYLNNVPMALWSSVAGVLHFREEKTASQVVEDSLKDTPTGKSSCVYVQCTYTCMCMFVCV